MRYFIEHETVLEYPSPVREHHVELRLSPRDDRWQRLISCSIVTEPEAPLAGYTDYFGNRVDYFCAIPPHERLVTRMTAEVETLRENPFDFNPVPATEQREWLQQALRATPSLHDFVLHRSALTPDVTRLFPLLSTEAPRYDGSAPLFEALMGLMAWVSEILAYQPGTTTVHADLADAVQQGGGVCQDFAHLFISVVRSWGVPARYVMGYLDPGVTGDVEEKPATHAWAEVLVPGADWLGFDATHNLLANDHYVAVAVGRDSLDAAPQRGSFKGEDSGSAPQVSLAILQQ